MTAQIRWPLVLDDMEAEVTGERPIIIGEAPWLYDPREFDGFSEAQIKAGLVTPACGETE